MTNPVHTFTAEDNEHYQAIKATAEPIGLTMYNIGYSHDEGRLEARFGRWRVTEATVANQLVVDDLGTLSAMVVDGSVRFYFLSDDFDEGDGMQCTPFEDVEPL